ncbi:MAG: DJ-1/PfpI family protein [Xanthobacteraceae bacterium]|nr:DJ-1/PfpI family protein [Xanthobacteraceae bacterium]
MKAMDEPAVIGIVVYEGVEPIDVGGTIGVLSMAQRILPALRHVTIAEQAGPVRLASGLTILADAGFTDAPPCDVTVVTGGPGWRKQVDNPRMLAFLRDRAPSQLASVCTGALILAASGQLAGRTATTRRNAVGAETQAPLDLLAASVAAAPAAAVSDDHGVVTSGGVSLAIDGMLYILGRLYGDAARDRVAGIIEYDRAFAANRAALGHRVA